VLRLRRHVRDQERRHIERELADKCDAIESTGAGFCTAVDSSCLLQIGGGLSRRDSAVRPIHIAEILASA
jgi:L-lactate dehydrogenase complex protein LldE